MAQRLEGRTAVVTGSGRGIGREVAKLLAAQGAKVVVNDPGVSLDGSGNDTGPATQVVDEIRAAGGVAVANNDSVATAEGGERIIKTALDNWGRIDIVVNVAGIVRDRMIFNMTEEEWDAVLGVHLKGHFNTIKPASILMRQQRGGRIINFSSVSGLIGNPGQANYGAAKAAIAGLTRVVARDLGRYGVTCNAISPGAATRMTESVSDAALAARARAGVSSGTMMVAGGQAAAYQVPRDPEYVASMVAWLAGDSAWDVNGKIFHVVGGTIALASEEVPAVSIRKESGAWTVGELAGMVPTYLMRDVINPAPPAADLPIPGRDAPAAS